MLRRMGWGRGEGEMKADREEVEDGEVAKDMEQAEDREELVDSILTNVLATKSFFQTFFALAGPWTSIAR